MLSPEAVCDTFAVTGGVLLLMPDTVKAEFVLLLTETVLLVAFGVPVKVTEVEGCPPPVTVTTDV